MKKLLLIFVIPLVSCIFYGCSTNDDFSSFEKGKTNFPSYIEEYGIALAKEFRQTAYNLNEMGIFYSHADASPEFRERFFNDWYAASPTATRSGISEKDMDIYADPIAFAEGYRNLTDIQKKFIARIISESESSNSSEEFFSRLLSINKDIYAQVPEIEQERLFMVSSTLYYLVGEIESLKKSGQMFAGTFNSMPLLKTRSENGDGFWGECSEFFSNVAYTVGMYISRPGGQAIVKAVSRVVTIGGYVGYSIIACLLMTGDTPQYKQYCIDKYVACIQAGILYQWQCDACRIYCEGQHGVWDCPRPN